MIRRFLNWFKNDNDIPAHRPAPVTQTGRHTAPPRPAPTKSPDPEFDVKLDGAVDSNGPGKNVLIRNRFVREDTGTHETLKILDDSLLDSGEETGIDPYNTGEFDRSKSWDRRFR